MAAQSHSGSEPCLHDDDLSSHPSQDDIYSPLSNYSTYSHEVKYIFEPIPDDSGESDYTIIPPRNKSASQQQLMTQSMSHLSQHSTPRTLSSQQRTSSSSQLYRRTYSTSSCHSDHSNKENSAPLDASHSVYPYPYNLEDVRRKTWSPLALKYSIASGMQSMRSSHSNSNLEVDMQLDNIYEDCDRGPPKLAPLSGVFHSPLNVGRSIVRPIAFKPVNSAKQISPPQGAKRRLSNQDEGYGSHDYNHMTGSMTSSKTMNSSHSSHHDGSERSTSFSSDFSRPLDRPESLPSLNVSRVSSNNMEVFPVQTPSPSDSGVGELEAMLKEKDAELNTLRDVMDRNERAIFQVYEEKKSGWLKEMRELREEYERKFKIQQRKNYKTEQVLSLQVYKLQQEKKALKDEYDKLYLEKDILRKECSSYQDEVRDMKLRLGGLQHNGHPTTELNETSELRQQVRDLNQEVTQKSRELITLRTQLHSHESEMDKKNKELSEKFREILSKTEELKSLKNELGKLSTEEPEFCDAGVQSDLDDTACDTEPELLKPSIVSARDRQIAELKDEVDRLRDEILVHRANFEKDRETWLDEKNKVIRYQKQLQLNYVQMYRKNRTLEAEVEQLTLELESRDLKLMAMNGEESVC
ncbi:leucine zipper putative tumor suppressor 2 homolog [Haliotis asinina]|uniref:leucine zipper putative tumor suppressor 2 homolog n=1 Tax=Haliotis asinina TaxID=109174 RepID=UPI00353276DA